MRRTIIMFSVLILAVVFCVCAYADLITPPFTYPDKTGESVSDNSYATTVSIPATDETSSEPTTQAYVAESVETSDDISEVSVETAPDTVSVTAEETVLEPGTPDRSVSVPYIVARAAGICAVALAFVVVVRKKRKTSSEQ